MTIDESAFALALNAVAAGRALRPNQLAALSNLLPHEVERFARVWAGLAVDRRIDLLGQLNESETTTLRHDFNALYELALTDADPTVRRAALDAVVENESPRFLDRLLELLATDPSASVRAAAAEQLATFTLKAELGGLSAEVSERIERVLRSAFDRAGETDDVRSAALASLGYLDNEGVAQAIGQGFSENALRVGAIRAMGRSANARWLSDLRGQVSNEDRDARVEVARACGEIADEDAVPILAELVDDRDIEVRLAAIAALGEIGGEEARETLFYAAEDPNETVRAAVEAALTDLETDPEAL